MRTECDLCSGSVQDYHPDLLRIVIAKQSLHNRTVTERPDSPAVTYQLTQTNQIDQPTKSYSKIMATFKMTTTTDLNNNPVAIVETEDAAIIVDVRNNKAANLSKTALLKKHGVTYLTTAQSAKLQASLRNGYLTCGLYLAPANMSGYEVCPDSKHCRDFCLNESGRSKMSIAKAEAEGLDHTHSVINQARINRTKWFFEERETFMKVLIQEIKTKRELAKQKNMEFCVRLNCTSDISPEDFIYKGQNILQIFPDVQFYDYTKVKTRFGLTFKYHNYDLTYSHNGYNWPACRAQLNAGGKVAVVFAGKLPDEFDGFPVVSGNDYDMRFLDPDGCVIGLHYHPVAGDYVNGKFVMPNTPFVVQESDSRCYFKPVVNII